MPHLFKDNFPFWRKHLEGETIQPLGMAIGPVVDSDFFDIHRLSKIHLPPGVYLSFGMGH